MRITESKLRSVIRSVIKESVGGLSVYPFKVELDTTFGDEMYIDLRNAIFGILLIILNFVIHCKYHSFAK